ncbi:MAG: hypothetical protein N2167_11040 [Flavobacteriales bacterium]|nr:hypothetical protein [Flavobacteriales bacterium]
MIWKSIKHGFANKVIRRQLTDEQPVITPVAWSAVKNIGLIFQADNQAMIREVEDLIKNWENEGKQVQVLVYISDTKKITFEKRNHWQYCTKKDFSSAGVPKTEILQHFIQEPFDLLVDLNISGQIRLYTLSVLSKAKFKIGADLSINKHLPFTVDISKSLEIYTVYKLGQELEEQLKKIQFV